MADSFATSRRVLWVAALLLGGGLAVESARVGPVQARSMGAGGSCLQAGIYQVGPYSLPMEQDSQSSAKGIVTGTPVAGTSTGAIAAQWTLRGQLRITSYGGCGTATAGSFTVARVPLGLPGPRPNSGRSHSSAAIACRVPCWPVTGVQSATGSFTRDEGHANDPLYVRVSATITSTRPGPMMGRPCSTRTGCPPPSVITSTVSFSGVTGYLQVAAAAQTGTVTLSFLAPPAAQGGGNALTITLQGWRGTGAVPQPAPAS